MVLERYPDTCNGKPLSYVGLAAQTRHVSLYLHGASMDGAQVEMLREGFEAAGKKLDLGKSCLRFRRLADLAANAVRRVVATLDPDAFVAAHESARRR